MKALDQITFLAELSHLSKRLQELLDDYCHQLTAEQEEEYWREEQADNRDMPF